MKHFTVQGPGEFPIDMLRYDLCWPKTPHDVYLLRTNQGRSHFVETRISLSTAGNNAPTVKRWESFGWKVVEA